MAKSMTPKKPRFFATLTDWRAWLAANHDKADELWVGFHKKSTGKPSITWPESVDGALAFGWIDGKRMSLGEESYTIRFTPRKAESIWSAINIARVAELTKQGLMHARGLAAFEKRSDKKSGIYAYEQRGQAKFSDEFAKRLAANAEARAFFEAQPPWYRQNATYWVMTAKQEATRERRFAMLLEDSAAGRRLARLTPPGKKR
jgi:uncharacterized protein YdeI (YjbR/CyaY-like superfamily)